MGRIFSWEEITEGKVPSRSDFKIVEKKVRRVLTVDEKVVGAVLFGSVLRGDVNVESDIDLLVVYEGNIFPKLRALIDFAKAYHVPLQIIPLSIEMAELGIHTFNEGDFFSHLKWAAKNGGVIKEDPLKFIRVEESNPEMVLKRTFRVILNNVSKSICELSFYEKEKRLILLAKILEAPMHIVRAIVWYKGKESPEETEEEVVYLYRTDTEIIKNRLFGLLQDILSVKREYFRILIEILKQKDRKPYKEKYEAILQKIEKTAEKVREFIEANALLFFDK